MDVKAIFKPVNYLALAFALGLLAAQTVVQQHFHLDDVASADCVVCVHADTSFDLPTSLPVHSAAKQSLPLPAPASDYIAVARRSTYQTRAPPHIASS